MAGEHLHHHHHHHHQRSQQLKTAAVYLRVSTNQQNELNQEPPCLEVCALRGWTARVQAVVVFSINRIGRRRIQIARDLAKLARYGCSIVSYCEKFVEVDENKHDAEGIRDLLIQWWGWFAEREREEIVTRTRNAI